MNIRPSRRNQVPPTLGINRAAPGFTLIELMIAMLLGLIVIAGVASVFLAGQRSYRANQALGDVQDSSRVAFEMMARDIRDAGLTGCGNRGRVGSVLNNSPLGSATKDWWADWNNALAGYGGTRVDPARPVGTAEGQQVTGNDSIMLLGAGESGMSVATNTIASAQFTLNEVDPQMRAGDVFIVCDPDHAVIAQAITFNAAGKSLTYTAATGTPSNCSTGLAFPSQCTGTNDYAYRINAQLSKFYAADWYIGVNPLGGSSLYRFALTNVAGVAQATAQEMVRDVTSMRILYHVAGAAAFVDAATVSAANSWQAVDAVQGTWTLESVNKTAGTQAKPISRTFTATTTLRNRVN